jgi:hypothetical protein
VNPLVASTGLVASLWFAAAPLNGGSAARTAGAESVRLADRAEPVVHSRPGGRPVERLTVRTAYGSTTRLWVRARRGGWLKVSSLEGPGGAGWIRERFTRPAPQLWRRIEIDRSQRRLTVRTSHGHWSTRVVLGAPESPTPLGTFQVTDRLRGRRFSGVYGAWILVLSAYGSASRTSRLAVHGVPPAERSATGSAGCVRVPARALERLAREIPSGTPVRIRA